MNIQEFSDEFDILYNNIMSNAAPGLNLYEKSVFLTTAQEQLVKNNINPLGNKYQQGLDDSPKRQIDVSGLITTASSSTSGGISEISTTSIDNRAVTYLLPNNVLSVLNEVAKIQDGTTQRDTQVVPISFQEYTRLMSKPYKSPLKNQTWRLYQQGISPETLIAELIPKSGASILDYRIRYVRRPRPIILANLNSEYGGVTINGESTPISTTGQACELNPEIHREILDRAVELAKASYIGDLSSMVQLNNRNE